MSQTLSFQVPRLEGNLKIISQKDNIINSIWLESDQTTNFKNFLIGKHPLEAILLTQHLSNLSGISHGLAAVSALENYLGIYPTPSAEILRRILWNLSIILAHLKHFYLHILPNYININHLENHDLQFLLYTPHNKTSGDLPLKPGQTIVKSYHRIHHVIMQLQKTITIITGKFPVIPNLIPGGLTNYSLTNQTLMQLIRSLSSVKNFIENIWFNDVKILLRYLPETQIPIEKNINLISFGNAFRINSEYAKNDYSSGVYIDGKLELLNEVKITESLYNTFYSKDLQKKQYQKTGKTWIKGARYDTETMVTGALSRMLITYYAGGNPEISDTIRQITDELNLNMEESNCIASRLLAEIFEARFFLKQTFKLLTNLKNTTKLNQKIKFDFTKNGTGLGIIESPGGSLLHQVYIHQNKIQSYNIITASNWNLSSADEFGKTGIIEKELNTYFNKKTLNALKANRIIHSYYAQPFEAVQ